MIQPEDTNTDSTFEIVDNKPENSIMQNNGDASQKPQGTKSVSYGNILSNVAPPSALPDFAVQPQATVSPMPQINPTSQITSSLTNMNVTSRPTIAVATVTPQPTVTLPKVSVTVQPPTANQFPPNTFSAAIPPSKGIPVCAVPKEETPPTAEAVGGGGIMDIVNKALSSNVLSRLGQKATKTVDSIITTLDPQMKEYINSAGDTEINVASDLDDEVCAVREAVHSVFGKAWVNGVKLNQTPQQAITIGFENGMKKVEEKVDFSVKFRNTPTIAIENILFQERHDWYDLSILMLKDNEKQITVKTFSQATPIPLDMFLRQIENERPDYKHLDTATKLAAYLQTRPGWQENVTGLSRKEIILLSAKTLIGLYKNKFPVIN